MITLNSQTMEINKNLFVDLSLNDYRKIPAVIEDAFLIVKNKSEVSFVRKIGGKYYLANVQISANNNTLTAFKLINKKDLTGIKKSGQILKDKL